MDRMISMVQPVHVGNALRLHLRPPAGAVRWKVMRRADSSFPSDPADPGNVQVYEGDEPVFIDAMFVANDVMQFYRAFYTTDGATFTPSNVANGTARATYREQTTDVLSFLRDRLEAGLKVEVERGSIQHDLGYIPVINAAPAIEQDIRFPVVTVHVESEDDGDHGVGELVGTDAFDSIGDRWAESEGWMLNVRITVIGWSLNSDERIELRKAIRRVVIGNLGVFADRAWAQCAFGQQDVDSIDGEFTIPMFQTLGNFTCVAPVVVAGDVDPVRVVEVSATTF